MAKEFKDFDKEFADHTRTYFVWEKLVNGDLLFADKIESWDMVVGSWTQEQIRYAVYEAPDHRDWQMFRVSLKGWPTTFKLYRLKNYYKIKYFLRRNEHNYQEIWNVEKCRIDNYIGALVRGGFLSNDGKYTVIK